MNVTRNLAELLPYSCIESVIGAFPDPGRIKGVKTKDTLRD